jgi:nicotinamidase/pyrazinamidase
VKALLIVDMQHDFMPGGALGVPGADEIVPVINKLIPKFAEVLATQDWHPPDHMSFAENHPGRRAGDVVDVKGIPQILWPRHCVRHTHGAALVSGLHKEAIQSTFYKGTDKWVDSYSAFFDNARRKSTGLSDYLASRAIREVYITGVATDYCVLYTAIDAIDLGLSTTIIIDACRGINVEPGDVHMAVRTMQEKGARLFHSQDLP